MVNKDKVRQIFSIELLDDNAQYFNHYTDMIKCGHPWNVVCELRKVSENAESDLDPYTYEEILNIAKQHNERIVFDNGDYLLTANDTIIVLYQYCDYEVYDWTGDQLKVGDKVVWLSPNDKEKRDLRKEWSIITIVSEKLIKIRDNYGMTLFLTPNELVKASNVIHVDIVVK
jgi:hypothetical protein